MSSLLVVQHLVKRGLVPQLVASGVRTAYQSARNPYRFSAMAPKLLAAQRRCLTSKSNQMDELLHKIHHKKVVDKLQSDPRVRISYSEYVAVCKSEGLNEAEAAQLASSLHDTGIALHFSAKPLDNFIVIKPDRLVASFLRMMDADGSQTAELTAKTRAELESARGQLAALEAEKTRLDKLAYKKADRIIYMIGAYLVLQGSAVARLTWWELSWDIMEPITYLLTFGGSMVALLYFTLNKTEFTYDGLRSTLARKRMNKLYASNNFDLAQYQQLQDTITSLERRLQQPELFLLESLGRNVELQEQPQQQQQQQQPEQQPQQ